MYTYLKNREYYEDRYDDATVVKCRSGERIVNETFTTMEKKLGRKELTDKLPGWYLHYSQYYFLFVESAAAERAANREATITNWMAEDQKKDERLASAHVAGGTFCRACGKDMRVVGKDYMRRDNRKEDDILIMFECEACKKRMALWEDGTEWEGAKHECEKCGCNTVSKYTKKQEVISWTETCEKCGYVATETLDLSNIKSEPEPIDPYLELDRKRFVFGEDMMFKYDQKLKHFERLAKLNASAEDKVQHADVYDGIKQVKKLKIVQLKELLEPVFTKNGYSDFKLGDPQIGREVSLEFSCLDTKDDREEYQSKKTLHKVIEKALEETNWRVMSAGVSYRLGFLSGSLRAYESEEDLKKLVEQRMKKGYVPKVEQKEEPQPDKKPNEKLSGENMRESALVYFDKLMLGSVPAEVTLKSGKIKKSSIPILSGEMNPLLRVFIPMRDGDNSVPKFVREFDFKFGDKNKVPKVQRDSQGREIRRI
jgi:hypothetical protein